MNRFTLYVVLLVVTNKITKYGYLAAIYFKFISSIFAIGLDIFNLADAGDTSLLGTFVLFLPMENYLIYQIVVSERTDRTYGDHSGVERSEDVEYDLRFQFART